MIKKFKFINLMPLALAALTTIIILIACGHGNIEDVNVKEVKDSQTKLSAAIPIMLSSISDAKVISSSSSEPKNSSGIVGGNSSSSAIDGNSSGTNASGSSSSNLQSSSSTTPSSSGESPYILTCDIGVNNTGVAGKPIPEENRPKLKCEVKESGVVSNVKQEDIDWENAPRWPAPAEGKYSNIIAKVDSDNSAAKCQGLKVTCEGTFTVCPSAGCPVSSSSAPPPPPSSSSTATVSSSSSTPPPSSSSSRPPSSSSAPPPSSSSSSSSVVTYTLACANVPTSGTAGTAITPPAVTCNGTSVSSSALTWSGTPSAPVWTSPVAGTYTGIGVSASSGNCSGKTATCSGTLTVAPPPAVTYTLTCTGLAQTGTVGTAIPAPTVTCSGGGSSSSVTTGLTWTPANLTPTSAGNIAVSVSASSGNCSSKTASCGTIAVTAPACDYQTTWCSGKKQSEVVNVTSRDTVLNGGTNTVNGGTNTGTCFFATEITKFCRNSEATTVNGANANNVDCWSTGGSLPGKADGGYYIWIPANNSTGAWAGSAASGPTKTCPP